MSFILASASPRRLELVQQLGLKPESVFHPEIDETPVKGELPEHYALRMAQEKARKAAEKFPHKTILAADTVVACGRRILPKAEDEKTVRTCLTMLSGRRHRVYTGVSVMKEGRVRGEAVLSIVQFKRLTEAEITAYIASNEWQEKAGGYAIQGRAAAFIPWMSGSVSNIIGLPLYETAKLLGV